MKDNLFVKGIMYSKSFFLKNQISVLILFKTANRKSPHFTVSLYGRSVCFYKKRFAPVAVNPHCLSSVFPPAPTECCSLSQAGGLVGS